MWKTVWMIVLIAGMGSFIVTAVLVAVRALPELRSLLRQNRQAGESDNPPKPSQRPPST